MKIRRLSYIAAITLMGASLAGCENNKLKIKDLTCDDLSKPEKLERTLRI
jgi:hypothetical protein